jgi:hypothetical protein
MSDFVIVAATLAALATASPQQPLEAVVPQNAPTVGFKLYQDIASCEAAVARLTARPGMRLVCLPVETSDTALATAY